MSCDEVRDLLPLYAGGEARENERVAAEAHLAVCAACARELDQYREMRAHLAGVREEEAPSGTWRAIAEAVWARVFPQAPSRGWRAFDTLLRYVAVLAFGLAVGVLTVQVQRGPRSAGKASAPREVVDRPGLPVHTEAAPVTGSPGRPLPLELPRPLAPRVTLEGSYYLPRVESIPPPGEREF